MRNISITEKLILYFLMLGIGAIMLIGYYSYNNSRKALMTRTFDQLTSVRNVRKNQIESFFNDRVRDINLISRSKDIYNTILLLEENKIIAKPQLSVLNFLISRNYYKKLFICNSKNDLIELKISPNDSVINFSDVSSPGNTIKDFLIKINTAKKTIIKDYNVNEPYLYIGTPVLNNKNIAGYIILEISDDAINSIMLENSPENGLGISGESYLVGNDFLMRSRSRFISESFIKTKVYTDAVLQAFNNGEGSSVVNDYRNVSVLSSSKKLNIPGLNWVILAEIDLKEAMVPIYSIRNNILFYMMLIAIFFFIFAYIISRRISMPIIRLNEATKLIAKGDFNVNIKPSSADEIGTLTESFNIMTNQLRQQKEELKEKDEKRLSFIIDGQENERQRLSRELHDGLGQSLIAIKLMLESTEGSDIIKTQQTISSVKTLFNNTISDVRRMSDNLMPAVLTEFGLTTALRNLCNQLSELSGINITYDLGLTTYESFSDRFIRYIYRIIQEALNNIVKHSEAENAEVKIYNIDNNIILNIKDDGKGFNLNNIKLGNGLNNLKERVNLLQGSIDIITENNKGTDIIITLPIQ